VVATVARIVGDLGVAEVAAQEAYVAALATWPKDGMPDHPRSWLIGVAKHKALDAVRRESNRSAKEMEAALATSISAQHGASPSLVDDQLSLLFMCCHPALSSSAQVALTLRAVCGLTTREIAASFLMHESTMAKRLTRTKEKISQSGIPFRLPKPSELDERLGSVLRVVYLAFTEGHMASAGDSLTRPELCDDAIWLARELCRLLPDEHETLGLLSLLLLTDARRPARTDAEGGLVLLEDQDRTRWDTALIVEGEALVTEALRRGAPGSYQIQAAIAACHATAASAETTDWVQISMLYRELMRYDPSPVNEANRAVAVGMSDGPAVGLAILAPLLTGAPLRDWTKVHVAHGYLLGRLGHIDAALGAYRRAIELGPPPAERASILRQADQLQRRTSPTI
jgi:RNA polymerase sigma-70 factor (ECF subfamily)